MGGDFGMILAELINIFKKYESDVDNFNKAVFGDNYKKVASEIISKFKSKKRSTKANRLYWLWMKCLEDETGESNENYHKYFKQKFIGARIEKGINNLDIVIEASTANMLSKPFNEYMKKVQSEAAIEFGITLPLPEDLGYEQFLEHYKDYL